jgi:ATP-dependent exoDNAse (exonuclease V) alpha subunit
MKSQGSGFKVVILVTMPEHGRNMTSNLLYVGITRAKERVVHIGDYVTINECVPIKEELSRLTYLKDLLDDIADERKAVAV